MFAHHNRIKSQFEAFRQVTETNHALDLVAVHPQLLVAQWKSLSVPQR